VRKGEKSVQCVFFGTIECEAKKKDEDNETTETVHVIRPFWLLQLCLVYINTLMILRVLSEKLWATE
jgi:hypothetical protein